jgi:hypothetical protein
MEQAAKKPIQPYTNSRAYTTRSAREVDKTNSLEARSIKSDSLDQPFEKITKERSKEPKKREVTKKWDFAEDNFNYDKQMKLINDISKMNLENSFDDDIAKIAVQEINKKICSYKHQDIIKKKLDINSFIDFNCVIDKMIECELKCRYCKCEMSVLYDITREMKQWSVDRIDNDKGHNKDNFHLACLDCNLKRRRRTDEKFLFTKQLSIVKKE